ncbi:MAG: hypothetical protein ACRYF0_07655 [Janthinobacterium lividum]
MSVYTVTIDQLMQLDKDALAYALRTFDKELAGMLDLLAEAPEARHDQVVLADLTSVLTLRKALSARLLELEAAPQLLLGESSTAMREAA